MNVKEVVAKAKEYAQEFLAEESVGPFQLEEIVYDEKGIWNITIGYYVNDPKPASGLAAQMEAIQGGKRYERKYKIFKILNSTGDFLSMEIRDPKA